MNSRLLGVVLAGGRSSRMGRPKESIGHPVGGTFLEYAVARLSPCCKTTIVVGGEVCSLSMCRSVPDIQPGLGPVAGIATAMNVASDEGFDACCVTPIDMPFLTRQDLRLLQQQWRAAPNRFVCGVARPGDQIQPLVAVYPTHLRSSINRLLHADDRSLVRWIRSQPHTEVPLPSASCRNINSPEDLDFDTQFSI